MNERIVLVGLSTLITFALTIPYLRDTLQGKTRPNRVSWGLWAAAPLIGTGAALSAGADPWVTVRTFLAGFLPLVVFCVSFINRQSYWQISFFDWICGSCSVIAIVLWLTIGDPLYALLLTIIGDTFATLPTLAKTWKYPETETGITYFGYFLSAVLILPLVPEWNLQNTGFLFYLIITNAILCFAIYRKRLRWS